MDPFALTTTSLSRTSDSSHLTASDLALIADELDLAADYRLIGGHAVTLLTHAFGVSDLVPPRETADADFGAEHRAIASAPFREVLTAQGYQQAAGNRFTRTIDHGDAPLDLVVDVLSPAFGPLMQNNQPAGDLVVDQVPGLAVALSRDPVLVDVSVRLTTDQLIEYRSQLPDVTSALSMKAYAYQGRLAERDAIDVWRLLECSYADGKDAGDWPQGASGRETAAILHRHFGRRGSSALSRATADPGQQTRILTLLRHCVPQ